MANTYQRIYLHIIFAVKYREALLEEEWRDEVFKYIAGIINERGHYSLAVNGYNDHIHILLDYNGRELISDLVREIKKGSNKYINDNKLSHKKFQWQGGYGVFSQGYREKSTIIEYIKNQKKHHSKEKFSREFISLLHSNETDYDERYLFQFHDAV